MRVPALVNAQCKVLQGQVRRADGGLVLPLVARVPGSAVVAARRTKPAGATLGEQGLAYVDREYRWPTVLERVESLLDEVSRRRSAPRA